MDKKIDYLKLVKSRKKESKKPRPAPSKATLSNEVVSLNQFIEALGANFSVAGTLIESISIFMQRAGTNAEKEALQAFIQSWERTSERFEALWLEGE
ncbi:MAG: hypothetical protein ABIC19_04605 [Patescibacteria group bacterium]